MKHSINNVILLKKSEGCRLTAYPDTNGIYTIGYGATYYQGGTKVKQGDTISQEDAETLLNFQLGQFEAHVNSHVTKPLNQNQFDALLDFAFNCGNGNLDSSTLLKEVNKNPNDPDITSQFKRWIHGANGVVEPGLVIRRANEAALYFK